MTYAEDVSRQQAPHHSQRRNVRTVEHKNTLIAHLADCRCAVCLEADEIKRLRKATLHEAYATYLEVRRFADEMHHHGLTTRPACEECIEMTLHQHPEAIESHRGHNHA